MLKLVSIRSVGRSIYRNLHEAKNYIWFGTNRKNRERNINR